jgi:D-3-phosphoglycerate dehydrogenase
MARYRVVATDDRHHGHAEERSVLAAVDAEIVVVPCTTPAEVAAAVADADAVLCDQAPMPAEVIGVLSRCRVISRYGVGCDNVAVAAATARGIWVANVPDYCVEEVSDHTLALVLACVRRLRLLDSEVRAGKWNVGSAQPIHRLQGKTYGLVGYGLIARTVHRKLAGFQFGQVLVYDPFVPAETVRSAGAEQVGLDELCERSDVISVHVPLNDATRGLIGAKQCGRMKSTAVLVNVARGPVVNEAALVEGLLRGQPMMAGIDVFESEPPVASNPLLQLSNVIVSDHVAYYSRESIAELKFKAARNVAEVLAGRPPLYPVNRPASPGL